MRWLLPLISLLLLPALVVAHAPGLNRVFPAGGVWPRLDFLFDATFINAFQYYHPDNLTSTTIQTDAGGNRVQHHGYSAFGRTRYTLSTTAFPVSRRYTCQVLDEDTGLYYYGARYYDPQLGRFIQPDDIISDLGNPQSYNRYSYVLNNPLRYTDPDGQAPQLVSLTYNPGTGKITAGYSEIYENTLRFSGGSGVAPALMVGSMVPVVGEVMDLCVLGDPGSRWWEKGLAAASLTVNAVTVGVLPNVGGFLKGGKQLCKEFATTPRVVEEAAKVAENVAAKTEKRQLTVIGHLKPPTGPGYAEVAESLGANYLKPSANWNWQKQGEFIKGVIERGDDVLIGTPIRPGESGLRHEIKQLIKAGYEPVEQGSKLLIKKTP